MPQVRDLHSSADVPLRNFAAELPDEFLMCRTIGHPWRYHTARWIPQNAVFESTLRCSRCHTERVLRISQRGVVLGSAYRYPDGYLTHGLGITSTDGRATMRLESLGRVLARSEDTQASG